METIELARLVYYNDNAAVARRYRTGSLRGYGNAIIPRVAAIFIRAFLDVEALDGDPQAD